MAERHERALLMRALAELDTTNPEHDQAVADGCVGALRSTPQDAFHPINQPLLKLLTDTFEEFGSVNFAALCAMDKEAMRVVSEAHQMAHHDWLEDQGVSGFLYWPVEVLVHEIEKDFRERVVGEAIERARGMSPDEATEHVREVAERFALSDQGEDAEALTVRLVDLAMREEVESSNVWGSRWPWWDRSVGGFEPGALIVLAGIPRCGKTTMACQLALGVNDGRRVLWLDSEMGKRKFLDLVACQMTKGRETSGKMENGEHRKRVLSDISGHISPQFSYSRISGGLVDIEERMERTRPDLVVLDNMSLLTSAETSVDGSRYVAGSNITARLKRLAVRRDCCVVLITHMNRAYSQRGGNPRPRLADLRDTGSLEQDADVVAFIHRPDLFTDNPITRGDVPAELVVLKNRITGNELAHPITYHTEARAFGGRIA